MAIKTVKYTLNGQTYDLTYNSQTKKYEATITAPAQSSYSQDGHKYAGKVEVKDNAGNTTTVDQTHETLGEALKLRVLEKVVPEITITYPTDSAFITTETPKITFKVTDAGSGVDKSTIKLVIGETTITESITATPTENGFDCTYTSTTLGNGKHTIKVMASDNDGNATTSKPVTFTIDTIPPTLNVNTPAEGLVTNVAKLTVSGTTDDATSKPVTVTVNGQAVTVAEGGTFTKEITLTEGANTITVVATDKAGKTTTVVRNVTLNTHAPEIRSITLTPNPVDCGKTFVIAVEVVD
ncbi:Ig-like domain-containing protein [Faecalimonas sp.]